LPASGLAGESGTDFLQQPMFEPSIDRRRLALNTAMPNRIGTDVLGFVATLLSPTYAPDLRKRGPSFEKQPASTLLR